MMSFVISGGEYNFIAKNSTERNTGNKKTSINRI